MTTFIGNLRCIIGAYFLYLSYTISYPITPLIRISQGSRPQPIILLLGLGDLPADEVPDALRQDHVTAVDMNSGEVTVFEFFPDSNPADAEPLAGFFDRPQDRVIRRIKIKQHRLHVELPELVEGHFGRLL